MVTLTPVFLPEEFHGQRGACQTPLQSMGLQRVRHNWANNTHTHTHTLCQQTITGLWLEPLWVLKSLLRSQTPFFPRSFIPSTITLFPLPLDPAHFMGSQKCQTFPWINRNLPAFLFVLMLAVGMRGDNVPQAPVSPSRPGRSSSFYQKGGEVITF